MPEVKTTRRTLIMTITKNPLVSSDSPLVRSCYTCAHRILTCLLTYCRPTLETKIAGVEFIFNDCMQTALREWRRFPENDEIIISRYKWRRET